MKKLLLLLFIFVGTNTVGSAKEKVDNNRYEIEMAEVGEPGTLVVKVWCYNKKPLISEDVAKMNAIKGVLFKGVSDSGRMNENHKDYFDDFFNDGKYLNYTRVALNNYVEQNSLIKVGKLYKIGKIVVISYNDLRKQLETDKIIKGLDYGF